ncbi:MAG: hypothetical protein UE029_04970 [Christensenellales bacterium]|nr:hypothetical protein [Christensenellales bacterium]
MGKYATIIHDFSPKENHLLVDFFAKKAKWNEKNISRTKKSYDWEDENSQAAQLNPEIASIADFRLNLSPGCAMISAGV